jgi:hypothetical protein
MKLYATLIKTGITTAMPLLLVEDVYGSDEDWNDKFQQIWELRVSNSKYSVSGEFLILYDEVGEYVRVKIKKEFIECVKDGDLLLCEFHLYIQDKWQEVEKIRLYITVFLHKDKIPEQEEIQFSKIPVFNVKGFSKYEITNRSD